MVCDRYLSGLWVIDMAKKLKKRKPKKQEWLYYEFELEDWKVTYSFRGQTTGDITNPDKYSQLSQIELYGKPISPVYKSVSKVQVYLWSDPKLEDHWKDKPSVEAFSTVGHMTVLRDKVTLDISCHIPPQLHNNILNSLAAKKIKYMQVYGEKLRWGRGGVFRISFSMQADED